MKIKPLSNRLVIKLDEIPSEVVTKAGIILVDVGDVKKMNVQTGIVISVGPGVRNQNGEYIPSYIKEGDWIVFNHHAVFRCEVFNGEVNEAFLYVSENDVVAVLEKE